jgi:3-methylcrotonyl-CoA carboxylase alpha subunit
MRLRPGSTPRIRTSGFLPATGTLDHLMLPEGERIRIDTGVRAGDEITPFYDPMIAKIIAHGPTREAALDRLAHQFGVSWIAGPKNNLAFLASLVAHSEVRAGGFDTGLIDRDLER